MARAAHILVVDDEPAIQSLLAECLEMEGYHCETCGTVDEALDHLRRNPFELVLADFHMPRRNGLELLREVRTHFPQAGFLMATAQTDVQVAVEAMREGATDYFVKPLSLPDVVNGVRRALEKREQHQARERDTAAQAAQLEQRTRQLEVVLRQVESAGEQTLQALGAALDLRAQDVAGHSARVSRYSAELARAIGYAPDAAGRLERSAFLHDIGKLGIPDAILLKQGGLDPAETAIMRSHVEIGHDLVSRIGMLAESAELVLTHQERFDGTGYPRGLAGEAIPLDARLFAVADALDAMTSDRPYRKALSWESAATEIIGQSGRHFDPKVVEVFKRVPPARWRELQAQPN